MHVIRKKLGALAGLGLLAVAFWAPAIGGSAWSFRRISLEQGLSQSTVYCIYQDHLGYLWFGTYDGLNRYDGYSFRTFKFDPNDPGSISNNRILAIAEDGKGHLWVGTDGGGLNRLDRATGKFERFPLQDEEGGSGRDRILAILCDSQKRLWIGTGGGGLLRRETDGSFKSYRRGSSHEGSLSHNRVRVLFEDSKGRLWVGTGGGGLNLYRPQSDSFQSFRNDPMRPDSLSDDQIDAIVEDRAGQLWVGTYSGGLNRFDPDHDHFDHFRADSADYNALQSDKVRSLFVDDLGYLWIATDQGLDRLFPETTAISHYRHNSADPDTLSDDEVLSLYQDRSGVFWVGTRNGGINKLEFHQQSFHLMQQQQGNPDSLSDNRVYAIYQDLEGRLWVGSGGSGLDCYDTVTGHFVNYRHADADPRSLIDNSVLSLDEAGGYLWVGTRSGLSRMAIKQPGVFEPFRHRADQPGSLANDVIWTLLVDHEGQLWVGSEGGLDRWDPTAKRFVHFQNEPGRDDSLGDNVIWCLFEDRRHRLWIGTENNGLSCMEGPNRFRHFRHDPQNPKALGNNTVLSVCEEGGSLWIGTWGGGLNQMLKDGSFLHFRERDGLPNDVVYGILGDGRGNLWLSTNRGLSAFNIAKRAFRNYTTADGLQGMEFNPGAYYQVYTGEMYFGGNGGLNNFHPDFFRENQHLPQVLITAFRQHEELVSQDIAAELSFELDHRQNYLSFEFVAFDYNDPGQNRYAYRLEGEDPDWIVGKHRFARYNNLDPGDYVFRVKASNNDNLWNEKGVAIKVRIVPPFFRTHWFYLLCVLTGVGLIFALVAFQRQRFKQEEAKALVAHELERKTLELEEARCLQLSMLPRDIPQPPGLLLAVAMQTASEVGGDYYDFHLDDHGVLTAAVGDATGHGLRAGTMVSAAKGLFLTLVADYGPAEILSRSSKTLRQMGFRKMFMAMAVVRFEGRSLTLAAAGMPPVYVYRAATGEVEALTLKCLPLGGPAFDYRELKLALAPGDVVLLNSDGLEEMFNENQALLGAAPLRKTFAESAGKHPEQTIADLLTLGREWAGKHPQADDITLMIIKVV